MSKLAHSNDDTMTKIDRDVLLRDHGIKIVTSHVYPPIPVRQFDWCAHYDDPEGPCGYGPTEAAAVDDLIDNYPRI